MAKHPILTDNTRSGMVIGWADDETEALAIVREWAQESGIEPPPGVSQQASFKLDYDPDIHTIDEVERVNHIGIGWVLS